MYTERSRFKLTTDSNEPRNIPHSVLHLHLRPPIPRLARLPRGPHRKITACRDREWGERVQGGLFSEGGISSAESAVGEGDVCRSGFGEGL